MKSCLITTRPSNYTINYVDGNLTISGAVADTEAPVITCLTSITVNTTPGLATGTATLLKPIVSDNVNRLSGNALHFDGANDYVSANLPMTAVDNMSMEMWIKPALFKSGDVNGGSQIPVSYGFDDGLSYESTNGMSVALVGSELYILYSGVSWFATGYNLPSINQWYHICFGKSQWMWQVFM